MLNGPEIDSYKVLLAAPEKAFIQKRLREKMKETFLNNAKEA